MHPLTLAVVAAWALSPEWPQTWGQPRPTAVFVNPRLPIGDVARRVVAPATGPTSPIADPFAGPVRTITYVVTREVRVRPSEVVIDPPEVHFVTPPSSPPEVRATDTGPR